MPASPTASTPPAFEIYRRQQARISRRRLYPVTLFYSSYSLIVLAVALLSSRPVLAVAFFVAGLTFWTLEEWLFHRYVLHQRFPERQGIVKRFLHRRLDPLHWEHHARPFDGRHINGTIRDTLPLFLAGAPLSFIAPIGTLPVFLAGVLLGYVLEEWTHHSTHFYNFSDPYFRYIKRHHGFHHTPAGIDLGYGLTSGFWDVVFNTHYPEPVRRVLYGSRGSLSPARHKQRPLYDLDQQLVPVLLQEAGSGRLSKVELTDLALSDDHMAETAASFGPKDRLVSQALERLEEYGLISIDEAGIKILNEQLLIAYAGG